MSSKILHGHVLDVLKNIPDNHFHCVVTSPPYYGLRGYGTPPQIWGGDHGCNHNWVTDTKEGISGGTKSLKVQIKGSDNFQIVPETEHSFCTNCNAWRGELGQEPTPFLFIEHLVEIFREVKRTLRPDGTFWLNIADSYTSGNRSWDRSDPKLGARTTGFRPKTPPGLKTKELTLIPFRLAIALQEDGWWVRQDIIWAKGRSGDVEECGPGSCMPHPNTDRCVTSHEYVFLLTKQPKYFFDYVAIQENGTYPVGTVAAKGSKARSSEPLVNSRPAEYAVYNGKRNRRSVWLINTQGSKNMHFAAFPEKLVETCISAGTSEKGCCATCGSPAERIIERDRQATRPAKESKIFGTTEEQHGCRDLERHVTTITTKEWKTSCKCNADLIPCRVLDPFAGSGTVGAVCKKMDRSFVGTELQDNYVKIATDRIKAISGKKMTSFE